MTQDATHHERTSVQEAEKRPSVPDPHPGRAQVVIADDEAMIRKRIATLLSARYNVVATAADGPGTLEEIRKHRPAIAVIDISMPGMTGIEVTRRIHAAGNGRKTRVVILSVHDDAAYVDAAFEAGAKAYVVKFAAATELVPAIEAVISGETYLSTALRPGNGSG